MNNIEQQLKEFQTNKLEPLSFEKGLYSHNLSGININVIQVYRKYVVIKWGEFNTVRSISFMNDFTKIDSPSNKLLH